MRLARYHSLAGSSRDNDLAVTAREDRSRSVSLHESKLIHSKEINLKKPDTLSEDLSFRV